MSQINLTQSYPIVMFDCSGSTEHSINVSKHLKNIDTVLKYEIAIAQRLFNLKGIKYVYVIMWNYTGRICSDKPILVSELGRIRSDSFGGTCLSEGLKVIPENWISENNKEKKEIYIFTDGEIEDDNMVINPLKKLIDLGIKIQIITVEPNNINYLETKGEAGHKLFQAIKSNGLTKSVRRFSSYNEHHVIEPFISFDNPEEIEGFTSFGGEYYNIEEQQDELVDKVEEAIKNCGTKEDIVKLAHELSVTIHHMVKDKSTEEQIEINNQFSDMFAESNINPGMFSQVNKMLLLELDNHSNGTSTSFHEFKDALILYT